LPINQDTESALLFEDANVKTIADTYTFDNIVSYVELNFGNCSRMMVVFPAGPSRMRLFFIYLVFIKESKTASKL